LIKLLVVPADVSDAISSSVRTLACALQSRLE